MRQLFDIAVQRNKNYFDDFLEPLFYTGLNQNRGENAYFVPLNCRIPFLNGGLFEQLDGYDWEHNDFSIPNEIFSNRDIKGDREADGILDIFDRYNFTIAEDEPMEREIAIDPEMLGKVFENLLDVKDRKSKGAFYTPREIVHFMCQETLINFLANKTGIPDEDIRKFILYSEYFYDEDTKKTIYVKGENGAKGHMEYDKNKDLEIPDTIFSFKKNVNRLQELDDLLSNVKVADLAVGSGAFPLGMLTEIVKARSTITAYLAIDKNSFDRGLLYANRSPYRLKRAAIKNSIFACDIEPSATDITKLRLWLSLVIDNQIMDYQDEERGYDTKPRELPNLDCNIICGNSLMDEFGGIPLITENAILKNESKNRQFNLFDSELSVQIQKLIDLQSKLYDEKDHVEKDILKEEIQDIYDQIILTQIKTNPKLVDEYFKMVNQPSKPFVLWQLYFPKVFRDNGGFDIVIGNPPYVLLQDKVCDDQTLDYFRRIYHVAKYKVDLYHLFIEKGITLLCPTGTLSFIVPSNFTTNNYTKELRRLMLKQLNIKRLTFYDENVFKANVNNLVFVGTKALTNDFFTNAINIRFAKKDGEKWTYYNESDVPQVSFMKDDFIINPNVNANSVNLIEDIESSAAILKKYANVNFGMQLRNRKKFTTDVITDESLCTKYHKKCYTGKDISFYKVTWSGLYCYFNREAKCGGCWDETAQFSNPKILIRQIGKYPIAGMDMQGYPVLNTAFMVSGFKEDISPFYILGVINSKLIRFYWLQKYSDNRKQFPKIKGTYLEMLPIKRNKEKEIKVENDVITVVEQFDQEKISEIDALIYDIYGISKKEQKDIDAFLEGAE